MYKLPLLFLRLFLFWILVFFIQRTVFVTWNIQQFGTFSFSQVIKTFAYGCLMDISMTSYILLLNALIFIVTLPLSWVIFKTITRVIAVILIVISSIATLCDAELQHFWGTRINEKALSVLLFPRSIVDAVGSSNYIWLLLLMGLMIGSMIFMFNRVFRSQDLFKQIHQKKSSALIAIFLIPIFIVGARGGVQKYPISKSTVFFTDNFTCNYSALNPLWNIIDVVINIVSDSGNSYYYFPESKLHQEFEILFSPSDSNSCYKLFTIEKPNVVIILFESFSAENVQKLGGSDIAPKVNKLLDNSLWFENFYANGHRSEHALVALLSGAPPLPGKSLLRESNRLIRLPMLSKLMKDSLKYELDFYNTYDVSYARGDKYLQFGGFEKIISDQEFKNCKHHQWGTYDEYLFDFVLQDLQKNRQPFFSLVLTSVSHEPFKAEVRKVFVENSESANYKNTIYYTDSCLYSFLMQAKSKPWYKNTVFIIMADHGHSFPNNRKYYEPLHYKIPCLIYGEPLKQEYKGKSISIPSSQIDIPATLLYQLGMKSTLFPFSRNMINNNNHRFTFFSFSDGLGYVTDSTSYSYNTEIQKVVYSRQKDKTKNIDLFQAKVILQYLQEYYKELN